MQQADAQMMLYRARLQLEEGQHEAALAVLEGISTTDENMQRDVAYLRGWCYIQRKQWDDAIHVLSPLLKKSGDLAEHETQAERERVALYLLRLGLAACELAHYEDASFHFTVCLKLLHDKRIHLPAVRVKARYSLGMTCLTRGLNTIAIQHYEEALRLCHHYQREEELPDIYHGLCYAYRCIDEPEKAYAAGQDALRYYRQREDHYMIARVHYLLGEICAKQGNAHLAANHYRDSLALACSHTFPTLVMLNYAALAEVCMAEQRLEDMRSYGRLALESMERTMNLHMRGKCYYVLGKLACMEAEQSKGERRQELLEVAVSRFKKALEQLEQTQARADRAEVSSALAQTLEELGRVREAIRCWRSAYEVLV